MELVKKASRGRKRDFDIVSDLKIAKIIEITFQQLLRQISSGSKCYNDWKKMWLLKLVPTQN